MASDFRCLRASRFSQYGSGGRSQAGATGVRVSAGVDSNSLWSVISIGCVSQLNGQAGFRRGGVTIYVAQVAIHRIVVDSPESRPRRYAGIFSSLRIVPPRIASRSLSLRPGRVEDVIDRVTFPRERIIAAETQLARSTDGNQMPQAFGSENHGIEVELLQVLARFFLNRL